MYTSSSVASILKSRHEMRRSQQESLLDKLASIIGFNPRLDPPKAPDKPLKNNKNVPLGE